VCIALSSDEEDEGTEEQHETTTLAEDGSEIKPESGGEYSPVLEYLPVPDGAYTGVRCCESRIFFTYLVLRQCLS